MRYAYLGPAGTFAEAALQQVLAGHAVPTGLDAAVEVPAPDVITALNWVRAREVDRAVVPIENSVEGGVSATVDTLAEGGLVIISERLVPVEFVVAAAAGTTLDQVRQVGTHPHAFAQTRRWVARELPGAVHVPAGSTAGAAKLLAEGAAPFQAVICAAVAAQRYGLSILATGVADRAGAVTRFVEISLPVPPPPRTGADKTTLQVHLAHNQAGALLAMLEQFAVRGVNLSRIESRPAGSELGNYTFSIDAEGHLEDERVAAVLVGLHRVSPRVEYLGSYPRADAQSVQVSPGVSDADFRAGRAWVESLRTGSQ